MWVGREFTRHIESIVSGTKHDARYPLVLTEVTTKPGSWCLQLAEAAVAERLATIVAM